LERGRLSKKKVQFEPGNPWENGCLESFYGKLQDEFLDREI
jgi:hypothetical protein